MFNLVCFWTNIILIVSCSLYNVEFDIERRLRNTEYRNIIIHERKSNWYSSCYLYRNVISISINSFLPRLRSSSFVITINKIQSFIVANKRFDSNEDVDSVRIYKWSRNVPILALAIVTSRNLLHKARWLSNIQTSLFHILNELKDPP